ncbi:MAG: hypothetical protein FD180_4008 [Planctomycetota bacterium]|nr:MAG: hypothetical protein FD180_4008 [Planctomycetota bacterium]
MSSRRAGKAWQFLGIASLLPATGWFWYLACSILIAAPWRQEPHMISGPGIGVLMLLFFLVPLGAVLLLATLSALASAAPRSASGRVPILLAALSVVPLAILLSGRIDPDIEVLIPIPVAALIEVSLVTLHFSARRLLSPGVPGEIRPLA